MWWGASRDCLKSTRGLGGCSLFSTYSHYYCIIRTGYQRHINGVVLHCIVFSYVILYNITLYDAILSYIAFHYIIWGRRGL